MGRRAKAGASLDGPERSARRQARHSPPRVSRQCALEAVLAHHRVGETYNIGGEAELPLTVIDRICAIVDAAFAADPDLARRFPEAPAARGGPTETLKRFIADSAGHDRRYAVDGTKARAELGYAPRRSFDEGLAGTLAWYLANEDWWRPLLSR